MTELFTGEIFRGKMLFVDMKQPFHICLNLVKNGMFPKKLDAGSDSNCVVLEMERCDK
ncbi:MAG: hypothetical protein LBT05_13100 [Planctomycetaceae bacterium]|nr:hypothetical protein [Planctomycetaceae bacterium]